MARRSTDVDEADRLYQLPLNEFVAARNALARRAGPRGASIRTLPKPTLPAWAVNQLYWRQQPVYQDLLDRAADLRATHAAASRGRSADLRGAGRAHEEAIERALKAVLAMVAEEGHPVTDATRQAIATTLRGLPGEEPAGRLTRPLEPRGFEALTAAAGTGRVRPQTAPARHAADAPIPAGAVAPVSTGRGARTAEARQAERAQDAARLAAARAAETAAVRARQEAEQALRRDEFEAARAARAAERADARLQQARTALEEAQAAFDEAQRAATAAAEARDAAQTRARESDDRATTARQAEEAARREVQQRSRR